MKDLKSATTDISGDVIPLAQLVALLAYLNIVAEIVPVESSDTNSVLEEEKEYIMPCVLENTSAKELDLFHKESYSLCFVEPLLVFQYWVYSYGTLSCCNGLSHIQQGFLSH